MDASQLGKLIGAGLAEQGLTYAAAARAAGTTERTVQAMVAGERSKRTGYLLGVLKAAGLVIRPAGDEYRAGVQAGLEMARRALGEIDDVPEQCRERGA